MSLKSRNPAISSGRRATAEPRTGSRLLPLAAIALAAGVAASCARPPAVDYRPRIEAAREGLAGDPAIEARAAEVEAAMAREEGEELIDEVEIRVGEEYDDDHRLRMTARVPVKSPAELRSRQEVRQADTALSVARLEAASLGRRAELCFPSIDVLVHRGRVSIYDAYVARQKALLEWSEDWRRSGVIDELAATRFEIDSRTKLATREPPRPPRVEVVLPVLPRIGARPTTLVRTLPLVRDTVNSHHPSVAVRRAAAERYRALSNRAESEAKPWLKFVDVFYEREARSGGNDSTGGRLAFEIPFGAEQRASAARYRALVRQESSEAQRLVEEQVLRSLDSLDELADFESRAEQWQELEELARAAEQTADRWWQNRLADPAQVADLLDEAFAARNAVLDARERAAIAGCTLLAMTGVPPEDWPRE